MRLMLKASMLSVCAAAFMFAAAQSPFDGDPPPGSYDIGPYTGGGNSGGASSEESADDAAVKKKPADKQPKAKTERSANGRRQTHSFSAAFSGPQKTCPVCSSTRLKNNLYVDCDAGRIHVCSAACIDRVRRNPAAFAEILKKRGEQLTAP